MCFTYMYKGKKSFLIKLIPPNQDFIVGISLPVLSVDRP